MYRSQRKSEDMTTERFSSSEESSTLQNGHVSPQPQSSFFSRLSDLPLVREATNRIQNKYQDTKERSDFLRNVLERGETTVAYSWGRAADVIHKTGIQSLVAKPLNFVDSKAVQILDTVEKKLPFIGQSQYEIKLALHSKIDGTCDQFNAVRDNLKSVGTTALENVKHLGEQKVRTLMETPVGQTVNQKLEGVLNSADEFVDKLLPEGHSHMNGNGNGKSSRDGSNGGSNGWANGVNGFHNGNLEHAKCLTAKLTRRVSIRVSSKSHDFVDAVKRNSIVSTGRTAIFSAYAKSVELLAGGIDASLLFLSKVLPVSIHERITLGLNQLVSKVPKQHSNGSSAHLHEN